MESSLETAGLSTGFIIVLGIAYRILKHSNFQFSSSCRERLVREASEEIRERVKTAVELELIKMAGESKTTSPRMATAVAPRISVIDLDGIPPTPPSP